MKKEYLSQLVAFLIFYLDSILQVDHTGVSFSNTPIVDFVFLSYSVILFLIINYVLIPRFFYKKKHLLFLLLLIGLVILFGIIEETVIEKILSPDQRGLNDLTWQSIYWYIGEKMIPLLTFITIKFVFDNFAQQQKIEKIEKDRLTNELQLLKSQIQPHILFNSLNNLYHFALKKADEVPDLILKLANVLRYVLYETSDEKVDLNKELVFIKDYIVLQEIQYKGRGKIIYDIQNEIENESMKIAPFLLIPFIENSFKHSFGTKIKNVFIEITITMEQQNLRLFAENNFEQKSGKSTTLIQGGIGLRNVKKRLELLYPNQHNLKMTQNQQKYMVDLTIKLT